MIRVPILGLIVGILAGCALPVSSANKANQAVPNQAVLFTTGEALCAGEVGEIYFPENETTLSPAAFRVIGNAARTVSSCVTRKIYLIPVHGNDLAGGTSDMNLARAEVVKAQMSSLGVNPNRFTIVAEGPLLARVPSAPIARVMIVVTR
jgi:outer membrane protein OmpA-like peptidoglycan-associated protein